MEKALIGHYASRLKLLETAYRVTVEINAALKAEEAEKVLALVRSRQRIFGEIDRLEERMLACTAGSHEALQCFIREAGGELAVLYGENLALLAKIKGVDDENLTLANEFRHELAGRLRVIRRNKAAVRGYGLSENQPAFGAFIDAKK